MCHFDINYKLTGTYYLFALQKEREMNISKKKKLIFISLQSCQQLSTMATKVKVHFIGGHFVLVNILLILMFKTQFITLKINLVKHTPYTNDFPLGIALCMYMPNAYIFIIGWVVKQPTK